MASLSKNPILIAEEIGSLLEASGAARERLGRAVAHLKQATDVQVCSLFRKSRKSGDLFLEFTDGLSKDYLGHRALRHDEGLSGRVASTNQALAVRDGPSHPAFSYVPGLNEEVFHSYLGVPVQNGRQTIGVLVVQTASPHDFDREDIALLNSIARQVGPVAAPYFRRLDGKDGSSISDGSLSDTARIVRGRSLAPGCFAGPPVALDFGLKLETVFTPPSRGEKIEIKAVRVANAKVRKELAREARAIGGSEGEGILTAHRIVLQDDELTEEVLRRIREGASAAESIRQTALRWVKILEEQDNPAFAARTADFRDIAKRMFHALGIESIQPFLGSARVVAIAPTILPGDIIRYGREKFGAMIITDQGVYSHTAILARSFSIPAVQMREDQMSEIRSAQKVMVDGTEGIILIDPDEETAKRYFSRSEVLTSIPKGGPQDLTQPTATPDGRTLQIGMNAGFESELDGIEQLAPDDIGLFRTELAVMSDAEIPPLQAQIDLYRGIMAKAGGRRLTFRTFDFGGDKLHPALKFEPEENPMMGHRSTRYMLAQEELFSTQLRALLIASDFGPMGILLPMISTPEELNLVLDEINHLKNELSQEGTPYDHSVSIGVMIEVPAAAFAIEPLSRGVDFFCVGANDLIQYLMAADRSNPRVSALYQWHHPAILAALRHILGECQTYERPVTMCGEMANHPWAAMVLTGMGYVHLSVDRHSIGPIKWVLRQISSASTEKLAEAAMHASSSTEVIEIFYAALPRLTEEAPPIGPTLSASLERLRAHALW